MLMKGREIGRGEDDDVSVALLSCAHMFRFLVFFHTYSRTVHAHWWAGSFKLLGYCKEDDTAALEGEGFGVTPAVLSTGGAVNILARLKQVFEKDVKSGTSYIVPWLKMWGPSCW